MRYEVQDQGRIFSGATEHRSAVDNMAPKATRRQAIAVHPHYTCYTEADDRTRRVARLAW